MKQQGQSLADIRENHLRELGGLLRSPPLREEPLTVIVCFGVPLLFALLLYFPLKHKSLSLFLEYLGTTTVLFGGLWTALGVVLSTGGVRRFRAIEAESKDIHVHERVTGSDVRELASFVADISHSLLVASTYARIGAWCLMSGTILLLVKMLME